MQQIKDLERINLRELEEGVTLESSWHAQYRGCNYVYIGGLPYTLTEGDVECMMSQFGTVTDLKLVRNDDTNESKGFGFVQYADWRSTVLAVDNFNGVELMRRRIRVDHVAEYKKADEGPSWFELKQEAQRKQEKKAKKKDKKKKDKKKDKKKKKGNKGSDGDDGADGGDKKRRIDVDVGGILFRGKEDGGKLVKREDGSFAIEKK